jgi:CRISPR-associated exonuclease Cas4
MFSDEELLPISGLQHLMFCERQWALIHLEMEWAENVRTTEGKQMHEFVHEQGAGNRAGVRVTRGLRVRSLSLGLYGVADLVEFHTLDREDDAHGARIPGLPGLWRPYPVEYKRGRRRYDRADETQLCAQALCLEEMLSAGVPVGAIYYGQPRRRSEIILTRELRDNVARMCDRARELYASSGNPPQPKIGRHCSNCSLEDICMPRVLENDRSSKYIAGILRELSS